MKFFRIDVRDGLLHNSCNRVARQVEEVEIDFENAVSVRARVALERGMAAMRRYDIENARRAYCDASELARRDKDGLVEAAALMQMAMQSDGMTNHESQTYFLGKALEAIDFEIFTLCEKFVADAAAKDVTVPIMNPRNALRELIDYNLAQYKLRNDSLLLAESLTNANRHLASADWEAAKNVANIGASNATEMFGANHWWVAVMMAREATAHLRQQKPQRAKQLVQRARYILQEWTDFATVNGGVFKREFDILSIAEHDLAVVSA